MRIPFPVIGITAELLPFAVIAISMVIVTVFVLIKVLPRQKDPPLLTQLVLALSVLFGGSVLLLALLYVFLDPNGTTAWTWVLLSFNFMMMFPAGVWFIGLILFRDQRIDPTGGFWPAMLAIVATGSEALMGVLFAYGAVGGPTPTVPALATGLSSVWFFWSMAAVMAALLVWAPLGFVERWALVALAASSVLAPWVTAYPTVGGLSMSVLMGASFIALVRSLLRGGVAPEEGRLLVALAGAFLAMTLAGLAVVATAGSVPADLAFGTVMGVVMAVEVAYLIRRYYRGHMASPWVARSVDPADAVEGGPSAAVRTPAVRDGRPTELPVAGR